MSDADALALLRLLDANEGASTARIGKRLDLDRSRLQRLLSALGEDSAIGGLGLVAVRHDGARTRVFLTESGRRFLQEGR